MIRLYMDHHVASAITAGLRMRGVDVLTAEEPHAGSGSLRSAIFVLGLTLSKCLVKMHS